MNKETKKYSFNNPWLSALGLGIGVGSRASEEALKAMEADRKKFVERRKQKKNNKK